MNCLCSKFAVAVHRFGQSVSVNGKGAKHHLLHKVLRFIFHLLRYLNVVFCKILFWEDAALGTGIRFSGKGKIIVGAERIGDGCVIHHNVTFGMHLANVNSLAGKPKIGNGVWIGPNTIIHGNIKIGDGVTILGGTVLTKNVPSHCVVSGNPARILRREFNNTQLLASSCYDVNPQTLEKWTATNV